MKTVPPAWPTREAPYRIALVGEAAVTEDVVYGRPFAGTAGKELDRQLRAAGVDRAACFVTNVFDVTLPDGGLKKWCVSKAELTAAIKEHGDWNTPYFASSAIERGLYLGHEHWPHVERLRVELADYKPHVIVALGNTALWALTGTTGMAARRGARVDCALLPGTKVIPTYHPAAVIRQYEWHTIAVADLMKAKREGASAEWEYVTRELWLEPDRYDLLRFEREYLRDPANVLLSVDIETSRGGIDCIGFAPSRHMAMVVPFVDTRKPGNSYWPTHEHEVFAWDWCKRILEDPMLRKLGQNFTYDWQFLAVKAGIIVQGYAEDTRLLSHALYPELPKSLQFLGSVFENEQAWKLMGRKSGKRDDA